MVRIANRLLDCIVNYSAGEDGADIEIRVKEELTDEDILAIRDAEFLEEMEVNYGEVKDVIGKYVLVGWKSIIKGWDGLRFCWQTYRTTDLDEMKKQLEKATQDNEDLTQALLELAEIVGGNNG